MENAFSRCFTCFAGFNEYRNRYYPDYCPGWALLYSQDVLFTLYAKLQQSKYFWIDDVLVTGILREESSVSLTNVNPLVLTKEELEDVLEDGMKPSKQFLYGPADLLEEEIRSLWEITTRSKIIS